MLLPAGKTPLVDTSRAEGFNMSVLKRMDEDILEILYSATHVAVYEFDTGRKSWRRSDIEGTLFLVKRCSAPRFRMIVVNSKRIDNFMEEVDGSLECEVLQTFLLYTKGNNQLYGIWFYDEKNCEEFGNYLKRIVKGMPKASPSGTPTMREKAPATAEQRGADLRNELQSIFSQLNGQSSSQPSNGSGSGGQKPESDHLMRLFLQAKERSPAASTPLVVATTMPATVQPPPAELPNAEVVLTLDTVPTTNQTPSVDAGPSSTALPTVPLIPLPPDFFKPSSKPALSVTTVAEEHPALAPDPVNLPMPVSDSVPTNIRDVGMLGSTIVPESNGVTLDGDNVASSLARFFARSDNEEVITDNLRDRFRQALVNLLSNDEILDLLIAEFKKVGIPFQ